MPLNLTHIVPGRLPDPVFELLVKRAGISSEPVIAAVRDHLVCGLGKQEAWLKHGINQGSFSTRTKRLLEEAVTLDTELKAVLPYLMPADQAQGLASAAQELGSALLKFTALTSNLESGIQDVLRLTGRDGERDSIPQDADLQD